MPIDGGGNLTTLATVISMYPLALPLAAVAVLALRTRILPRWLGYGAAVWNTPSLVETRFSPDALVWVTVVFHGTVA